METIESYRFNRTSIYNWLQAALQPMWGKILRSTKATVRLRSQMSTHYATNQNNDELLWLHDKGEKIARWLLRKGKMLHDTIDEQHAKLQQISRLVRSIVHALDHSRKIVFTVLLTALLTACAFTGNGPQGSVIAPPVERPAIRPPALGQQWVYQLRDVYSQAIVDEITETIVSTTPTIRIRRTSQREGPLPDEIHSQWGMLIQDSHWELPITFSKPIPAWPLSVELNHSLKYPTRYQLLAHPHYDYFWDLTMTPRDWQSISVVAGKFKVLHYTNHILFQSPEFYYRIDSERDESIWFSPEVGRWVLRRSQGTYYVSGRGGAGVDDYLQWELISWR